MLIKECKPLQLEPHQLAAIASHALVACRASVAESSNAEFQRQEFLRDTYETLSSAEPVTSRLAELANLTSLREVTEARIKSYDGDGPGRSGAYLAYLSAVAGMCNPCLGALPDSM